VSFLDRLQAGVKDHEATFAQCYAEADGNERKAKLSLRRKLFAEYKAGPVFGFDPATLHLFLPSFNWLLKPGNGPKTTVISKRTSTKRSRCRPC